MSRVEQRADDGDEHADLAQHAARAAPLGRRETAQTEDEEDRRDEVAEA